MTEVSKASAYPKSVQPGLPRLGVTPPGWSRGPLSEHLFEEARPVKMADDEIYDLVTAKRSRGGVVLRERLKGKEIAVKSQFRLKAGDFLISKRQIVHGACGIVPPELDGAIVSNEYAVLRARPSLNLQFLNCLAHSIYFQQTCFHSSIGVHVEKMIFKLEDWLRWDFDLPPARDQRRIAEILATWDQAIGTVEALIANAREQKAALMQALLSGERRLPGFTGAWSTQRLSDVADIIVSNVDKKSRPGERAVRLCNYTDVYASDRIESDQAFMPATASSAQIERFGLCVGDVVITKDSETPGDIAVPSYVASTSPDLVCGYHLAILRPRTADGQFLKYLLEQPVSRQYFASRANGATRFGLTVGAIEETPVTIPQLDEQQAIGEVVRVAELSLCRLTAQLADLRQEKAALMQQLLTGKRRVGAPQSEAA
ncbi:restriction endonuclease subunit S [Sphingomonas sp. ID0503]|uniref:restriction endonuclease subunit S n=1 Tax=Sphingomonas sp. ID0503 TaxID=3399691 RepID=UPI003AFAF0AC